MQNTAGSAATMASPMQFANNHFTGNHTHIGRSTVGRFDAK